MCVSFSFNLSLRGHPHNGALYTITTESYKAKPDRDLATSIRFTGATASKSMLLALEKPPVQQVYNKFAREIFPQHSLNSQ
jgi:hypothetical protein